MSRFFTQGGSNSKDESDTEEEIQEVQNTDINNRTMVEDTSDIISHLPLEMQQHILSFLPPRVAAMTSSLSKGWRDVFCRTPTLRLELDEQTNNMMIPFIRFVNRIVAVHRLDPTLDLQKFHISLHKMIDDMHDENQGNLLFQATNSWINFALDKRVTNLTLFFIELPYDYDGLPKSIFVASFLVELKLSTADHGMLFASNVKVHLPSLKILSVDMVNFGDDGKGFYNLLKGCPVIEELEMIDILWFSWDSCSVSSSTLKILSIYWDIYENEDDREHRPESVSFVTPNLVYLNYNDDTAANYKDLDFASLVEAKVLLHLRGDEDEDEEELELAEEEDVSDFMYAISNIKKLFLHADTLQVLAFGCHKIPPFPNLNELIIESHHKDQLPQWDSLPVLLNNCPQLHMLVFLGLTHQAKNTCGNVCRCEGGEFENHSCLETSPVKVLKIYDFGQAAVEMDRFVAMVRHFLVTMPHLERFIVYCTGSAETRSDLSRRIREIPRKASPMCRNQVCFSDTR